MSEEHAGMKSTPGAGQYLHGLHALAGTDPESCPLSWEKGGAIHGMLRDLMQARGPRIGKAERVLHAAGLGPWLEALAKDDPAGFMCLARWEDDWDSVPDYARPHLAGRMGQLRRESWSRVTANWWVQDGKDAAAHAMATGVGIRPGSWKGIQERTGVPRGEASIAAAADALDARLGPAAPATPRAAEADMPELDIPSFLRRRV